MRTKKQIFMLLLALLVGIPTLSAQSKKEKKEQKKEAVKKLIESENYKIDVNTAMPMRGRSIPLTSSYSLEIRNDSDRKSTRLNSSHSAKSRMPSSA